MAGTKGMSDDDFQSSFSAMLSDAEKYIDEYVGPERIASQKLFDGDPFGNEVDGRSQVVSTDVRDSIMAKIPSFMRVFNGSKRICEVMPQNELEVDEARDKSDAIDYFFNVKNDGFGNLYSAIYNAEVKKTGPMMYWFEERTRVKPYKYPPMTLAQVKLLQAEEKTSDDFEIISITKLEDDDYTSSDVADPRRTDKPDPVVLRAALAGLPGMVDEDDEDETETDEDFEDHLSLYEVKVNRKVKDKTVRVEAFPPEELIISSDAKDVASARAVGRRRHIALGALVELGYDIDDILEFAEAIPNDGVSALNREAQNRNPALNIPYNSTNDADPLNKTVMYYDVFVRMDREGSGYPTLRRVCAVGDAHHILHDEVFEDQDGAPIEIFCGNPIPHMAIGHSTADILFDIQKIKSGILRNTLDGLASSIFPRTAFDDTKVNGDDAMNTEIGAMIRVNGPPSASIQELASNFSAQSALSMLGYMDDIKAKRTGISDASQGLDPEALQSTTAIAANATINQGQERLELEARHYAESIKRVCAGILRTIANNWDDALTIRSNNGDFRRIDPTMWDRESEVRVRTGLGRSEDAQRAQALQLTMQMQKETLGTYGLNQPAVSPTEMRNAYEDLMNIYGVHEVSRYVKPIPQGWTPPQPDKTLDPGTLQAQANIMQAQVARYEAEQKHIREMEKIRLDASLERLKLEQDRVIKMAEIEAKYQVDLNEQAINAEVEAARIAQDSEVASALGLAEVARKQSAAPVEQAVDQQTVKMASITNPPQAPQPAPQPVQQPAPQPQPNAAPQPPNGV